MIRFPALIVTVALFLMVFLNSFSLAQGQKPTGERIAMCMIQLEHADAEALVAVLEPLLSPQGSIGPYLPTNTLIIRDRASIVEQLATAIKGTPCNPIAKQPTVETEKKQKE